MLIESLLAPFLQGPLLDLSSSSCFIIEIEISAREKGNIALDGHTVAIHLDFSMEVHKHRLQFTDIKRRLRNMNIPYSMTFPAKLRIVALGSSHLFDSTKDALAWLDVNER